MHRDVRAIRPMEMNMSFKFITGGYPRTQADGGQVVSVETGPSNSPQVQIQYMEDAVAPSWRPIKESPPINPMFMSGSLQNGVMISDRRDIYYIISEFGKWSHLKSPETSIDGLAGDVMCGPVVISGDIAIHYSESEKTWIELPERVPFHIKGITGRNCHGIAVHDGEHVALIGDYSAGKWEFTRPSPVRIDLITGDCTNGFIIYGEGRLFQIFSVRDRWLPLPTPNFDIQAMTGDPYCGIAAIINDGRAVAYCQDIGKGPWILLSAVTPAP